MGRDLALFICAAKCPSSSQAGHLVDPKAWIASTTSTPSPRVVKAPKRRPCGMYAFVETLVLDLDLGRAWLRRMSMASEVVIVPFSSSASQSSRLNTLTALVGRFSSRSALLSNAEKCICGFTASSVTDACMDASSRDSCTAISAFHLWRFQISPSEVHSEIAPNIHVSSFLEMTRRWCTTRARKTNFLPAWHNSSCGDASSQMKRRSSICFNCPTLTNGRDTVLSGEVMVGGAASQGSARTKLSRPPKSRRRDIWRPQKIKRRSARFLCASTYHSAMQSNFIAFPGPRLARLWRAMATTMDNDANRWDGWWLYFQHMQSLPSKGCCPFRGLGCPTMAAESLHFAVIGFVGGSANWPLQPSLALLSASAPGAWHFRRSYSAWLCLPADERLSFCGISSGDLGSEVGLRVQYSALCGRRVFKGERLFLSPTWLWSSSHDTRRAPTLPWQWLARDHLRIAWCMRKGEKGPFLPNIERSARLEISALCVG